MSGHKLKAPLALLGLVLSIVVIPMSAAHASDAEVIARGSGGPLRAMIKDQVGNLYITKSGTSGVIKISPSGDVTADFGNTGPSPFALALDSSGNIYTANYGDNTVSKITPAGGSSGSIVHFGDTGALPFGIALDSSGNIYTANSGDNTISKITPAGGEVGSIKDFITLPAHALPRSLAFDQAGNLLVTICGNPISGDLSTRDNLINDIRKITPAGVMTILGLTNQCPAGLVFDSLGNIYTANFGTEFGGNVTKITPTGDSSTLATTGVRPYDIAIDPLGNIYTSNYLSNNVTKITPAGSPSVLFTTGTTGPRAIVYSSGKIYTANQDGTVSKFSLTTTTSGSAPNSQVAAISPGNTGVVIPSTTALPATSLKFGGSVPESVTVVPVASNPATVSATPFTISGSTKIVDIQISGTFNGSATVCLDGLPTDHLYHYTGGKWEELPSRTYALGQVCGVTTSFSPFAAAPPVALVAAPMAVPVPDPVQQSKITALSVSTAIAGTSTPVTVSGTFVEKISAIHVNGVALAAGSWIQTSSSVAFTMPGKSAGTYQIQIYNGSAPVMKVQNFTFTAPIVVVAPTPAPSVKQKVTYIRCAKPGRGTRVAYGINPTCPEGYVKK